ncbi:MAG TPA: organomercurial lyase [Thermoanaerobaculia bacterium]|nr:organomercurial lyase [Thermoanaerobaculia bacterium]
MTPSLTPLAIDVRRVVYDLVLATGRIPDSAELAHITGASREEVRAALRELEEAHMLVLQRGSGEVLMAMPFSAVPTPFVVDAGGVRAWGNCIWDALGIPIMMGRDAVIETGCGCCGTLMVLHVRGGDLREREGIVHFGVPARSWWEDVVFT